MVEAKAIGLLILGENVQVLGKELLLASHPECLMSYLEGQMLNVLMVKGNYYQVEAYEGILQIHEDLVKSVMWF